MCQWEGGWQATSFACGIPDTGELQGRSLIGTHRVVITAVAFSPDGATLVSADWDGTMSPMGYVHPSERHPRYRLSGSLDTSTKDFLPDGRILLTGAG